MPARRRRAPSGLSRALRQRGAVLAYFFRRMAPPLLAVAAYTALAAALVRWEEARAGVQLPDFESTVYGLYTQLFFEPFDAFPPTRIARIVYWVTPLVGVVLLAEGLFKVGASLFDPAARREVWATIVSEQQREHIVVCGLGHVGYRVVEQLRALGEEVVCIERDEKSFVDVVRAMGVPVHVGDARRDDLLAAVGIVRARTVVCATGDDLANLEIAIDAKRMNPGVRVVMRMFDQRLAGKVGGALELDESFSTSSLSAPLIALQSIHVGVRSAYELDRQMRVTAEAAVGPKLKATTVGGLEETLPCKVLARRPAGGSAFAPARAADAVGPGDALIVDAAATDLESVRAALG